MPTIFLIMSGMAARRAELSAPFAVVRPCALAALIIATSSGAEPCVLGCVRSLKMRGELTIAACSGWASGILMTSMRKSAELGFCSGIALTQPDISVGDRGGEE